MLFGTLAWYKKWVGCGLWRIKISCHSLHHGRIKWIEESVMWSRYNTVQMASLSAIEARVIQQDGLVRIVNVMQGWCTCGRFQDLGFLWLLFLLIINLYLKMSIPYSWRVAKRIQDFRLYGNHVKIQSSHKQIATTSETSLFIPWATRPFSSQHNGLPRTGWRRTKNIGYWLESPTRQENFPIWWLLLGIIWWNIENF